MKTLEQLVKVKKVDKASIHYYPGKELSIYLDGNKLYSEDISRMMFEKLCEAKKKGNIEMMKDLVIGQGESYL